MSKSTFVFYFIVPLVPWGWTWIAYDRRRRESSPWQSGLFELVSISVGFLFIVVSCAEGLGKAYESSYPEAPTNIDTWHLLVCVLGAATLTAVAYRYRRGKASDYWLAIRWFVPVGLGAELWYARQPETLRNGLGFTWLLLGGVTVYFSFKLCAMLRARRHEGKRDMKDLSARDCADVPPIAS